VHIRLITVGDRQPRWVEDAFETYTARFPPQWRFQTETIATAKRTKAGDAGRAIDKEAGAILGKLGPGEQVVLLDERGKQLTSKNLAERLQSWQADGRDLTFIIGGPDGVSDRCRQRADFTWSLSDLTLPHGIARILFSEQLYRAWSLTAGHPYHRD
jgi:23S rRNA (pseudouridine1915-N3)-methyltransferase